MDDERERQERDLQRATALLETMSRQELIDMLHDILFNERSDDTRKLSDWMAFQIIIQDETRDARRLLAQLGKDGRGRRRVEGFEAPSDVRHIPKISEQQPQGHDEELEEDSSSTASFVTCPEADPFHCPPMCRNVKPGVLKSTDSILSEAAQAEVHGISGKPTKVEKRRAGDESKLGEGSALSMSEGSYLTRERLRPASDCPQPVRRRSDNLLASLKAAKRGSFSSALARPKASGKTNRAAVRAKALETTNECGLANLAELYARFDKVRMEGWRADLLELDSREALAQGRPTAANTRVSHYDNMDKWRCNFCKLFFTKEQNMRDIDNGSSPCSYHPGVLERNHYSFQRLGFYVWTCCHRVLSSAEFSSGPSKTPGCQNGYHDGLDMSRCCRCDRLVTDDDDDLQSPR